MVRVKKEENCKTHTHWTRHEKRVEKEEGAAGGDHVPRLCT